MYFSYFGDIRTRSILKNLLRAMQNTIIFKYLHIIVELTGSKQVLEILSLGHYTMQPKHKPKHRRVTSNGWNRKSRKRKKKKIKTHGRIIRRLVPLRPLSYNFAVLYQSSTETERKLWSGFVAFVSLSHKL